MADALPRPFFAAEDFSGWRGRVQVVHAATVTLRAGDVLSLEGPNGAGKTTFLEGVAGLHPSAGHLWLRGGELSSGANAANRVSAGVTLCPDGRHLFGDMSVGENLLLGGYRRGADAARNQVQLLVEAVPWLRDRLRQRAATLSGGEQQLVAVCRALVSRPSVLLLDAPTSGLAPAFKSQVADLLHQFLAVGDRAIILADDDADFVGRLASVRAVFSGGRLTGMVES